MQHLTATVLALLLVTSVRSDNQANCDRQMFSGFDSRLTVQPVGRFPGSTEAIVGFELHHGKPVVAYAHRLLMLDGNKVASLVSLDTIKAIAVSKGDRLIVQTNKGLLEPTGNGGLSASGNAAMFDGIISDSGNQLFLDVVRQGNGFEAYVRRLDGRSLPLVGQRDQPLRAINWNNTGLAVVYGTTLLTWADGARSARVIANDAGLSKATAACALGEDRVVVGVGNVTVLFSADSQLILVAGKTRCRTDGHSLYLLDEESRIVWKVDGLEKVGSRALDFDFARKMLEGVSTESASEGSVHFREAARILGCQEAEEIVNRKTQH